MRQIVPGDVILLRGMTGFYPQAELNEFDEVLSMYGPTLGHRMNRGTITLLVVGTRSTHFTNVEQHALLLLTPVRIAWAWHDSLFQKGLGNGELL